MTAAAGGADALGGAASTVFCAIRFHLTTSLGPDVGSAIAGLPVLTAAVTSPMTTAMVATRARPRLLGRVMTLLRSSRLDASQAAHAPLAALGICRRRRGWG